MSDSVGQRHHAIDNPAFDTDFSTGTVAPYVPTWRDHVTNGLKYLGGDLDENLPVSTERLYSGLTGSTGLSRSTAAHAGLIDIAGAVASPVSAVRAMIAGSAPAAADFAGSFFRPTHKFEKVDAATRLALASALSSAGGSKLRDLFQLTKGPSTTPAVGRTLREKGIGLSRPKTQTSGLNEYEILRDGKSIGMLDIKPNPKKGDLSIPYTHAGVNEIGPRGVAQLRRDLKADWPGYQSVSGLRISGARLGAANSNPNASAASVPLRSVGGSLLAANTLAALAASSDDQAY